jgi:hypothetical protein
MLSLTPYRREWLAGHAARPILHPLDWATANIDYSRCPSYDTPYRGAFDASLFPFWRQPLADSVDPNVREVVVKKCSRAGGSESFLLTRLRWAIANRPVPSAYYGADIESVESFMENRVKRGMELAPDLLRAFRAARVTEHNIRFPAMDFVCKWARMKSAYKQDGYDDIYADEVSTWPGFAADMLRKRADMYPFHHIMFISSPDPARKGNPETDPIVVLYEETDKRQWFMPDPDAAGKRFSWLFGGPDTAYGLKWPKDAKHDDEWDLDRVRKEAVYVTPSGTTITNDQRADLVAAGQWEPTSKASRDDTRGYNVVAPMIPTAAGDFGELAARFISAKYRLRDDGTAEDRQHNPIRVYFAEYWAEAFREEQVQIKDNALQDRKADYKLKSVYVQEDSQTGIYCTCDVQKFHLWWLARVWGIRKSGTSWSGLLDFGNVAGFTDLDAKLAEFSPALTGIDIGYQLRASEVGDYVAGYTDQGSPRDGRVFALRGSDALQKAVTEIAIRDTLEGRRAGGQMLFPEITFAVDVFRTWLMDFMGGNGEWFVPNDIGELKDGVEYLRQVTSTKKIDGVWVPPKHGQDHLFDCETMQLVLARHDQLIR